MKGLAAERLVARDLEAKGFLVSSRRHFGGAGDILAVQEPTMPISWMPLLVEVKATGAGPFANFPPADRLAMTEAAKQFVVEPLLAWVVGAKIFYLPTGEWPS